MQLIRGALSPKLCIRRPPVYKRARKRYNNAEVNKGAGLFERKVEAAVEENLLREAGENYLEAILRLEGPEGNVRSIDVATQLGVSRPSVNKALGVLKKAGMVEQQPYGSISLTAKGRAHALDVSRRHQTLKTFLTRVLGVDEETADNDACRMEHVVSAQTMNKLTNYFSDYFRKAKD